MEPETAPPRSEEVPSRLLLHRLPGAKATERGVLYRRGNQEYILAWPRVQRVLAGEILGSCESLFLFDLVIEDRGPDCVACRIEERALAGAQRTARAISLALGADRCDASTQALAHDAAPLRRFHDAEVYGDAVLEAVRFAS